MNGIRTPSFDDSTNALLTDAFDRVVSVFAEEDSSHRMNSGLLEAINCAIVDLASVGQRDAAQLERYAESRGRLFLHGLSAPKECADL